MKYAHCMILLLCLLPSALFAQRNACCRKPSGMQALAATKAFAEAHLDPLPYHYDDQAGSMISFETLDGKKGNAFYIPATRTTSKALIIFHEWWGLNDYIKRDAAQWQKTLPDVDVYAIDLYDGQVATTAADAGILMGGLSNSRADNIIKGLLTRIGRDQQIATLGYCMGGSWAFRASVLADQQASGCVMYYGFPEKEAKNIRPLKTDVLYFWGKNDAFISEPVLKAFETEVKKTGRKISSYEFENAEHAFANPSNPKYNAVAAAQARDLAVAFLKKYLVTE